MLPFKKSTNQQQNALLILSDLTIDKNQQINRLLTPDPPNFQFFYMVPFKKSTNQQQNALWILRGLVQTLDKINKSTVFCNLFLWIFGYFTCFQKSTNQQQNARLILSDLTKDRINSLMQPDPPNFQFFHMLPFQKSTNQQQNVLILSDLTIDKINKSTVFCNQILRIFSSFTCCHFKNQQINSKTRY